MKGKSMTEQIEDLEKEFLKQDEEELDAINHEAVCPGWWWIRYQGNPFTQAQVEERGEPAVDENGDEDVYGPLFVHIGLNTYEPIEEFVFYAPSQDPKTCQSIFLGSLKVVSSEAVEAARMKLLKLAPIPEHECSDETDCNETCVEKLECEEIYRQLGATL